MDGATDRGVAHLTGAVFQLCPICCLLRQPLLVQDLLLHKSFDLRLVEHLFPTALLSPFPILFFRFCGPVAILPAVPFHSLLIVPVFCPSVRRISLIPFPFAENFSILSHSFVLRCWSWLMELLLLLLSANTVLKEFFLCVTSSFICCPCIVNSRAEKRPSPERGRPNRNGDYSPNMASINSRASKGCKSSICSPTPI